MIKFLFKDMEFNRFDLLLIVSVFFIEPFTLLFWVWIIGGSAISVVFGGSSDDVQKLQAEITKIRQGEKDMRDTITLYDKTITRIAHHIQDQGNAKHFCTSGIDFDDGTAKEICDYITKINEELKMSHLQLPTVSSGSRMPKVKSPAYTKGTHGGGDRLPIGSEVEYPSGKGVVVLNKPDDNGIIIVEEKFEGDSCYKRVALSGIKPTTS